MRKTKKLRLKPKNNETKPQLINCTFCQIASRYLPSFVCHFFMGIWPFESISRRGPILWSKRFSVLSSYFSVSL